MSWKSDAKRPGSGPPRPWRTVLAQTEISRRPTVHPPVLGENYRNVTGARLALLPPPNETGDDSPQLQAGKRESSPVAGDASAQTLGLRLPLRLVVKVHGFS